MRDRIFYVICFGFVLGVLMRSFFLIDLYLVFLSGVIALALLLFFILDTKYRWGVVMMAGLLALCFGVWRFHMIDVPAPLALESNLGNKISFSGMIVDEPSIREDNQRLTIQIENEHGARVLVSVNHGEEFKYGDIVRLEGTLRQPENFTTDQGKDFDYVNYLRKDNIFYLMSYPDIKVLSRGHGSKLKSTLFAIKARFLAKMNLAIPSPEATLMGGLILGERSSFSSELRQDFIDTGTIHIVALSGYNVTIVSEWIMRVLSFLPLNLAFSAGILGIVLFVIMAGGQSTAVRAGTMAILALVARSTGRTYEVGRGLVLVGAGMIFFNPLVLAFDVSFQLSFIATVAVIFFAPRIERHFSWVTKRFGLRDIISVTTAAYIFVLPFILYKMGNLSLVALPANFLILPFIPLAMGLGFFTSFLGMFHYFPSVPFGYLASLVLQYMLAVVDRLASLPLASFHITNFPLLLTLAIYIYFIYYLFSENIRNFLIQH